MKAILLALHDIWCAVSRRCRVTPHDDPLLETLRIHEQDAKRAAEASRRRRAGYTAAIASMAGDVQRHWGRRGGDHVG